MTNEFKLSITLDGQKTTIEVDELFTGEITEVLGFVKSLLLGAGFQPGSIEKYLKFPDPKY